MLPEQVEELVDEMNENGGLKMPKDGYTYTKIFKRLIRESNNLKALLVGFIELFINIWYTFVNEFAIIIYNYFGAILVLLV